MENQKMNLNQLVEAHGNEKQLNALLTKGKLSNAQRSAVEVEAKRWYEFFKTTKEGRNLVYIHGAKLDKPKDKIDNRSNNKGAGKVNLMVDPLTSLLVYEMIERDYFEEDCFHFPISKFMHEFGIADSRFAFKHSNGGNNLKLIARELEKCGVEKAISIEVMDRLHNVFCDAIFTSLKNLEKRGLAKWYKIPYGAFVTWDEVVEVDENGNSQIDVNKRLEYQEMTTTLSKEIDTRVKKLLTEMNLEYWQVRANPNSNKVWEFKQKKAEIYCEYGIEFKYDAYCAYLIGSETTIREKIFVPQSKEEAIEAFSTVARLYNFNLIESRQARVLKGQGTEYFGEFDDVIKENKRNGLYADKAKKTYSHTVDGKSLKRLKESESTSTSFSF